MSPSNRPPPTLPADTVLTHHWLTRRRGGEKVLEALFELCPQAPVYTLIADPSGYQGPWQTPHESPLARIPGARRHYPKMLGLLPWAAHRVRLPATKLVLCSDANLAKAMRVQPGTRLVCYCHSPMRYAWEPQVRRAYAASIPLPLRPAFYVAARLARRADAEAARRVDLFIANSRHVQARIARHYGRESVMVHPPVDLPPAPTTTKREDYYLCVGQHVPYKRLDLAVYACEQLGRKLVVIGGGPDVERLRSRASEQIQFLGWQDDATVIGHYQRARGLLFCGEEDFGIVPVEAQSYGCPIIAYGVGGAVETVIDERTGTLFPEQTVPAVVQAIEKHEATRFDPILMHNHTQQFSKQRFQEEIVAAIAGPDSATITSL